MIVDDGLVYDVDKECWVWARKVKPKKNPIDAAHRSAIDVNFVFDHYIPNTLNPPLGGRAGQSCQVYYRRPGNPRMDWSPWNPV